MALVMRGTGELGLLEYVISSPSSLLGSEGGWLFSFVLFSFIYLPLTGRSHIGEKSRHLDDDILQRRWKSSAYKRYIEVHSEHIIGVPRHRQTSSSITPSGPGPQAASESACGSLPVASKERIGRDG